MIVAWQDQLLERPDSWLEHLRDGGLYISHNSYGNTGEKMGRILGLIREAGYEAEHVRRDQEAVGILFSVRERD